MHSNETASKQMACLGSAVAQEYNPTVGENLDNRIASLRAELTRLEAAKESLGPLLNMRIRDVRDAMSY